MHNSVLDASAHNIIVNRIERMGAERNVIAYILHNPEAIFDVAIEIKDIDFNNNINKAVYGHMMHLMNKGATINQSTIVAMMKHHDNVKPEDVDAYLEAISKTNTHNMDIEYNLQLVKRASVKRQTYLEALSVLLDCSDDNYDEPVDGFLGKQQNRFLDLALKVDSIDRVVLMADMVDSFLQEKASSPQNIQGLETGFPQLDYELGGLVGGRLYVVGARSKAGKSALLMNWGINISTLSEEKRPILFIDTEMSTGEVMSRMVAKISGVPEKLINNGMFSQDAKMVEKVQKARDIIKDGHFHHVYLPNFSIEQVVSLARKYYNQHNIGAVFFDYIKLSAGETSTLQRDVLLGRMATTLKDLAGTLNIPVITAVQLNRSAVGEEDLNESMVRGSDEILFYANYLLMLRRKTEKEIEAEGLENGNTVLACVASRHGGDYVGWLNFKGPYLDFEEHMKVA